MVRVAAPPDAPLLPHFEDYVTFALQGQRWLAIFMGGGVGGGHLLQWGCCVINLSSLSRTELVLGVNLPQSEQRRECWWKSDLCDLQVTLNLLPSSPAFTSVVCLSKPPPRLCQSAPGNYGFDYISSAPRSAPLPRKELASPRWWMALLIVSNWLLWKTLLWNAANLVTPIHCSALLILSHLAQALCNWRELHLCICGPTGSKDYWCKGMPVYKSKNTLIFIHCSVSEPPVHLNPPCFNDLNVLTMQFWSLVVMSGEKTL